MHIRCFENNSLFDIYNSKMTISDGLELGDWEVPDKFSNKDDLLAMLQLVQASLAIGTANNPLDNKGTAPLTNDEALLILNAIIVKIRNSP